MMTQGWFGLNSGIETLQEIKIVQTDGVCLGLLYLVMPCLVVSPWEACSVLRGNREGVDLGQMGGGLRGVEGGKTEVGMCCMREE